MRTPLKAVLHRHRDAQALHASPCLLGHVAAQTQLLCPNTTCRCRSLNAHKVSCTYFNTAAAYMQPCPNKLWDASKGMHAAPVHPPCRQKNSPARGTQLIAPCEWGPYSY